MERSISLDQRTPHESRAQVWRDRAASNSGREVCLCRRFTDPIDPRLGDHRVVLGVSCGDFLALPMRIGRWGSRADRDRALGWLLSRRPSVTARLRMVAHALPPISLVACNVASRSGSVLRNSADGTHKSPSSRSTRSRLPCQLATSKCSVPNAASLIRRACSNCAGAMGADSSGPTLMSDRPRKTGEYR